MYTKEDINRVKEILLKNTPNPKCIFLFGSYASGRATEDSDLDFAIVTENKLERKQKLTLLNTLWNETGDQGFSVDFVIKPFSDFESEKNLPTLSRVINTNGKILWQKD
jgi:predicted nucleotidyltransferase